MLISSFLNLAGPDFIVMAIIVVLAAPAITAIPIIFYLDRHRGRQVRCRRPPIDNDLDRV
jgi:hypothetical protein